MDTFMFPKNKTELQGQITKYFADVLKKSECIDYSDFKSECVNFAVKVQTQRLRPPAWRREMGFHNDWALTVIECPKSRPKTQRERESLSSISRIGSEQKSILWRSCSAYKNAWHKRVVIAIKDGSRLEKGNLYTK